MSGYVSRVVGADSVGSIAVNNDGDAFYVTPCCGASSKGMEDYTGCRKCYEEVDPELGGIPAALWFAPSARPRVEKFWEFMAGL